MYTILAELKKRTVNIYTAGHNRLISIYKVIQKAFPEINNENIQIILIFVIFKYGKVLLHCVLSMFKYKYVSTESVNNEPIIIQTF